MSPDGMGWSWRDIEETPVYVRRFCVDLMNIKRRAHAAAVERANRQRG